MSLKLRRISGDDFLIVETSTPSTQKQQTVLPLDLMDFRGRNEVLKKGLGIIDESRRHFEEASKTSPKVMTRIETTLKAALRGESIIQRVPGLSLRFNPKPNVSGEVWLPSFRATMPLTNTGPSFYILKDGIEEAWVSAINTLIEATGRVELYVFKHLPPKPKHLADCMRERGMNPPKNLNLHISKWDWSRDENYRKIKGAQ